MLIPTAGGGMMILPDNGPSGPWTHGDTKIVIVLMILSAMLMMISVVIEKLRGFTFREIFTLDDIENRKLLSGFSIMSIILFYVINGIAILGELGYLIYTNI